jgi:hypothetical protein
MFIRFLVLLFLFPCAVGAQEIFQPERIKGIPESALFVDLRLKIESAKCSGWTQCNVRASGTYNGQHVGLEVQIKEEKPADQVLKITYISVGAASDQLLAAIASLYRLPLTKSQFNKNVVADLVPLRATKDQLDAKAFFFANGPESRYAELYTNIDLHQGILWIKEKDQEYRKNVLDAFSK